MMAAAEPKASTTTSSAAYHNHRAGSKLLAQHQQQQQQPHVLSLREVKRELEELEAEEAALGAGARGRDVRAL